MANDLLGNFQVSDINQFVPTDDPLAPKKTIPVIPHADQVHSFGMDGFSQQFAGSPSHPTTPDSPGPTLQETVGNLVPQGATPYLAGAKKAVIDPFERLVKQGSDSAQRTVSYDMANADLLSQGQFMKGLVTGPSETDVVNTLHRNPNMAGILQGGAGVLGGTLVDPRNWPFLGAELARPALQRLISGGFAAQMGTGAVESAVDLHDNWATYTPQQRSQKITESSLSTLFSVMAAGHMAGEIESYTPTQPTEPATRTHSGEGEYFVPGVSLKDETGYAGETEAEQARRRAPITAPSSFLDQSNQLVKSEPPPVPRNVADLYSGEGMKIADDVPLDPEVEKAQRQKYLDLTKQKMPPPTEAYDSTTGDPVPRKPDANDPERGSLSFKKVPPRPLSNSPLGQLSFDIHKAMADVTPERAWSLSDELAKKASEGADAIQAGVNKLTANAAVLRDYYLNPVETGDFIKSVGKWSGDIQRTNVDTDRFVSNIKSDIPDKTRRAAVSRWINANGDEELLRNQADSSNDPKLKNIYNTALTLTPEEKVVATRVRGYFDHRLDELHAAGMMQQARENYIPQAFDQPEKMNKLFTDTYNYSMRTSPNFLKQRFYQDFFEAEQNGLMPKEMGDIGHLVSVYNKSMDSAMTAKGFLSNLRNAKAEDGRPVVGNVDGGGRTIAEPDADLHLITQRGYRSEEMEGYSTYEHPAFKDWKWVGKDSLGGNIFYQGQLMIHPDFKGRMENLFGTSPLRKYAVTRGLLSMSTGAKRLLLSAIPVPFHQVQVGVHAEFHLNNPFSPPDIDLTNPKLNKLLDGGLVLGDDAGIGYISEGSSGLPSYQHYLFGPNGYIARLKAGMAQSAFDANKKTYADRITAGKIDEDGIARLSAAQANNAFGGLNYKMLGRSPLMQDIFRLMVLAPDFTEARARFVGEALKPYGSQQRRALIRGALGMYIAARVANKVFDNDYHFDKPFSLVFKGKEYALRSLPGDIYHLIDDPQSFIYHRLNPVTARAPFELLSKKDQYGRNRTASEAIMDTVQSIVPIPLQVPTEKLLDKSFRETSTTDSLLGAAGVNVKKYRTPAERYAHQVSMDSMPANVQSKGISYLAGKIQDGTYNNDEVKEMLQSGKMQPDSVLKAFDAAKKTPLLRDFDGEGVRLPDAARIFQLASPKEKGILQESFTRKLNGLSKLSPEDQASVVKILQQTKK